MLAKKKIVLTLLAIAAVTASPLTIQPVSAASNAVYFELYDSNLNMNDPGIAIGKIQGRRTLMNIPCPAVGVSPCTISKMKSSGYHVTGDAIAPICTDESSNFCIEKVFIFKEGELPKEAKFEGYSAGELIKPQPEYGVPAGAPVSVFSAPEVPNSDGQINYAVSARVSLDWDASKLKFKMSSLDTAVIPLSNDDPGTNGDLESVPWKDTEGNWMNQVTTSFKEDTRVKISLRLPQTLGKWIHGRLTDANFSTKDQGSFQVLTVDAQPATVAKLSAKVIRSKVTKQMKDYVTPGAFSVGMHYRFPSAGSEALQFVREISSSISNKSSVSKAYWNFSTTSGWEPDGQANSTFSKCIKGAKKIQGFLTTNATAYLGTVPVFKSGTLNYKVAGQHYMPNGKTAARGSYELTMNSSFARCLYGFSDAPVSASISVVNEGGNKVSATTTVGEQDGWLRLTAENFTFSEKTIKVKIGQ